VNDESFVEAKAEITGFAGTKSAFVIGSHHGKPFSGLVRLPNGQGTLRVGDTARVLLRKELCGNLTPTKLTS